MKDKQKYLIICESPNKCATIKSFLPDNYIVMASVGHITKLNNSGLYNMGIDVKGNFDPDYIVDPEKKDVVKKLKETLKQVDKVYLASDNDLEGEAISYHLKNVLKIPDNKYERITYHEVTKSAIMNALENSRKIDENKANAAIARGCLDRITGFRLSPLAMTKVGCKSAGRVQSATLKILAMREDEINNFKPETYYEIWLPFKKEKKIYRAQYKGTDKKKTVSISEKAAANKVILECEGSDYFLKRIDVKERKIQAKPPFTTSTFQQEVSSKLGYSSDKAMSCAQKLFEGILVDGNHLGLITYHRTDSTELNDEFVEKLNDFVKTKFGKEYYSPVKKAKKQKNAQDGHEAMHVVDLEMTPDRLKQYIDDTQLIKVYKIIYERTLAAAMSDCAMEDKEFSIYNGKHRFSYSTHSIKFDGFRKVYGYSDDEDDDKKYPELEIDEKVNAQELELVKKETTPPGRYTEASLIKKMEDTGIGRPSTYASTLKIIQDPDRGYTEKEGKSLKVTEKGMRLSKFLDAQFGSIINLTYTSEMESKLDEIAEGKINRVDFLRDFYGKLCALIDVAKGVPSDKPAPIETDKICPQCGKKLVIRKGRYGDFIACSGYPKCKYTEKIEDPNKPKSDKQKVAAEDTGFTCPDCGKAIVKRLGKDGKYWYACSGFPKHKRVFTEEEIKKIISKQSVDKKTKDKS